MTGQKTDWEKRLTAVHGAPEGRTDITPQIAGEVFQNLMEGGGTPA